MEERSGRILVCLSPAPSNARILRAAADMARGSGAEFIALFVETPASAALPREDKERLREHMEQAAALGARVETVSGDDIPFQIGEYARLAEVDRVVLGQSDFPAGPFPRPGVTERLARLIPDKEIHIIPDGTRRARYRAPGGEKVTPRQVLLDVAFSLGVLAAATLLGALFDRLGFTNSNIMLAYLLGVLLIAVGTSHRGYSLASAIAAVFLFNFFFVQPRFTLNAYEVGYPVTFVIMFLTAFITGTLAIRLKQTARQAARTAFRTKIISDTDQLLAKVKTREEILSVCSRQLGKLLDQPFEILDPAEEPSRPGRELFPVAVQERRYAGVLVDVSKKPLEASERSILLSLLGECALALENERNAREKEEAAVLVENERLRSNLLRTISHDLRTPLTTISGNASNLMEHADAFDPEERHRLYTEMYEDAQWLTKLVENLLASTRIDNGRVRLRPEPELVEEIIAEAVRHVRPEERGAKLILRPREELLMVRADGRLIVQVVVNLLENALKYAPDGVTVEITAERTGDMVSVSVGDDGPGIPPEERDRIFDMFYVGAAGRSDSRRSLGLGLALCRSIVLAHGGTITVGENKPRGAVFTFTLPAEEVILDG